MSLWHLVWIIPAVWLFGFSLGAWLATARESPAPDPGPVPSGEDYCAGCPFKPEDTD